MKRIAVVVPCFNEADNIPVVHERVTKACAGLEHEILFVNDGSTDTTGKAIDDLKKTDPSVRVITFVRNCGHQAALRAGLRFADGDWVVTMDADLQHPPEEIPAMVARAGEGYDVVTMVHDEPQRGFLKSFFSRWFYRLFSLLSGVAVDPRASDFRLMTRRVVDALNAMPERNLFLRAIVPNLGFPHSTLAFRLADRRAGKPGYTFGKSLYLASEALFAFSTLPIRLLFGTGMGIALLAFVYAIVNVGFRIFTERNVPGYTDIVASVLFLGGLNLVMLSVIGKYLQIAIDHLKQRPEYVIDTTRSDYVDTHHRR